MELIKINTKDGMKYGIKNGTKVILHPIYATKEDMIKALNDLNNKKNVNNDIQH